MGYDHNRAMKNSCPRSLIVLALLLATALATASEAKNTATKKAIPKIACIGRIQIGCSTQEDLAQRWGEGKTISGGHPNSGRLWQVTGTAWLLQTDGLEYSKRGLVVDSLTVYGDSERFAGPELLGAVPRTRLAKSDFTWGGEIWLGMSEDKVRQILKRKAWPLTPAKDGCETSAKGFYAMQSRVDQLRTWTARLVFTNGWLSQLTLNAGFK